MVACAVAYAVAAGAAAPSLATTASLFVAVVGTVFASAGSPLLAVLVVLLADLATLLGAGAADALRVRSSSRFCSAILS